MKLIELNRKMNIYTWISGIVLILIISIVFFGIYSKRDKVYFVKYDDYSELDYNVALKENQYFEEEFLGKDRQYIASLIDHINANFKYKLTVKEDLEYSYKYKILANVNVIDNNTNKVIYDLSENVLEEITGKNENVLAIEENVKIDYNKYNNLISEFVKGYNLKNVTSNLNVKMYVGIAGTADDFQKEEDSVISLNIPLTTDTVGIDANYNLSNNVDSLITLKSSYNNSKILLYIAAFLILVDIGLVVGLIMYIKNSLTEEEKYKNELSKILNNYGTYISEVEDEFDMKDYQILKVKKFIDLLEIRDTMHIPIIMVENKENMQAYFIIPTDNKILYFFSLGVTQYALPESKEEKIEEQV